MRPHQAARALALAALAALCLPLVSGGCAEAPTPQLERPSSFHRGMSLGLFRSGQGTGDDIAATVEDERRALVEIHGLGATDVSLVVTWVQEDVRASLVRADPAYTATDDELRLAIRRAHALGLRVMLFPIVRLIHRTPEEWRGTIAPHDAAAWFRSYGALMDRLVTVAAAERVALVCVGSELASLERHADAWRAMIARARGHYGGRLLYSANWDHYTRVPFWPALDVAGVSGYWGVSPPRREVGSVEQIARAWRPIRDRLAAFRRKIDRPLVLTEVGYSSVRGAGALPWNDFLTGRDGEEDADAQRRLYEGFARAWSDEPLLEGVFFWMWFGKGGAGDRSYTPRGKPAEYVLRTWYRGPDGLPPPR